jgi:predicted unusual protein kinase regulating ubiquinone biosynthesis (AarF/ABC1/UbiB family)
MMLDPETSTIDQGRTGELARLPRRQFLEVSNDDATLSQMRFVSFEVNRVRSVSCLFAWFRLLIYFTLNLVFDALLGRDNLERRALHLRQAFERNGGSFVKLGLHLAIRFDLMPWVYCNELSRMYDRMQPFPLEQAIATVERSTGKPLTATFTHFDPQPIASTSVACIYQAELHTGEKVIVKIRRPGIGEQFMAEIRAFEWLLSIAEFLTIFRPGFTKGMRGEIRDSLLEELDFIQAARRQDAFRRAAAESRKDFFTAPRVHLNLSGEEVVVEEFASGLWLWELLAAVEQGNESVLARAREMNINPKKVAKRLLWVNYWSWSENLFFHANPQPYNIIIGHDGKLYFINFTITGSLSRPKRQAMRQNLYYAWQRDPQNMARSFLILMEPLPPIDLIELTQELEAYNWQLLYAMEAAPESLTWQERTSANQWIGMIQLARKYSIPMDMHVLLQMRSTLLCESIAVRLHPKIDFVRQYRKFNRYKAEQARRAITDAVLDQLDGKSNEQLIIRLDRIAETVQGIFLRTRHMLSLPSVNFKTLMSKWSYAVYILVRCLAQMLGITAVAVFLVFLNYYYSGVQPITATIVLQSVITNPVYQIIILVLIFASGRTVLFRLDDKEV